MVLGKKRGRFPGAEPAERTGIHGLSSLRERRGRLPPKPIPLYQRIPFPLLRAFLLGAVAPVAVAWAIARNHRHAEERLQATQDARPARSASSVQSARTPAATGAAPGEVFYDVDELLGTFGGDAGK
jgi:hypothetical protein